MFKQIKEVCWHRVCAGTFVVPLNTEIKRNSFRVFRKPSERAVSNADISVTERCLRNPFIGTN